MVSGTSRNPQKRAGYSQLGIKTYDFDEVPVEVFASCTHILTTLPTEEGKNDAVLERYDSSIPKNIWLGYCSTTGIYGDYDGKIVDESSELRIRNDRLNRRALAEKAWQERGGHIFRLAGIYGPGRNALEDVRAGTARRIDKPGQVFSRIHVEDIAQALLASMKQPAAGRIYNVCDNEAAAAHEVVAYASRLLGVEPPPLIPIEQAELSPMGREFYSANRRVCNRRLREELGVVLRYPTYREGLARLAQDLQ